MSSFTGSFAASYADDRDRSVVVHANKVDYDDILRLFTHRHTHSLFKRQAAAFRQIAREKKTGLLMTDLDPVCRVVQLGLDRMPQLSAEGLPIDVFIKPLAALIRLFGLPYVKKKAYEEFDNGASLSDVLALLVTTLSSDESELIHAVCQTIMAFLGRRTSREFGLRCELAAQAGIVPALVMSLQRFASNIDTALPLVTACRHLASIPSLAVHFDQDVFGVLVTLLERDFREQLVSEVSQLLALLLEQPPPPPVFPGGKSVLLRSKPNPTPTGATACLEAFATLRSVSVLTRLLKQCLEHGYRQVDKAVRNDLLVLLLLLTNAPSARKFLVETDIFDILLAHATQSEIKAIAQATGNGVGGDSKNGTATVGLGKIRALRTSGGGSNDTTLSSTLNAGSYALSSDIANCDEDFQFKQLIWSLAARCADDPACQARMLRGGGDASSPPAALLHTLLLYLDAADAFNARVADRARAAAQKSAMQNQAMTGALAAASTIKDAGAAGANAARVAALNATSRLSFSQLLQLQGEALTVLGALVPHCPESFVALSGFARVLNFAVAVVDNESQASDEKRLNAAACTELQARALRVLLRATQAGAKYAASCPVNIGTTSVDVSTGFGSTRGGYTQHLPDLPQSPTHASANGVSGGAAVGATPTGSAPNAALQDMLSLEGDDAFAAMKAAMQNAKASNLRSSPIKQQPSSPSSSSLSLLESPTASSISMDSSGVLSILLSLANDPLKPSSLRADALSLVALLVSRNPPLQRQLRQLRGVHLLAQFLSDDGARSALGLPAGVGHATTQALSVTLTPVLAAPRNSRPNLMLYAARHPQLLAAVVDALWSGIIGCPASEALFLALNGVDLTCDLLLVVPPAGRRQLLGFLSDLLSVPGAAKFLYEWRSAPGDRLPRNDAGGAVGGSDGGSDESAASIARNEGFTALELLLSLWPEPSLTERHEATASHENTSGAVQELPAPLPSDTDTDDDAAAGQEEDPLAASAAARARVEASLSSLPRVVTNASLRPALYAVFARLGFSDNNQFLARATPVQRAQLFALAHYLDNVRCEALAQVGRQLSAEGVTLVAEDQQFLANNDTHLDSLAEHRALFSDEQWTLASQASSAEVEAYLHAIVTRKSASEAFLLQAARRARKQTMRRRQMYKEMRMQLLANSSNEQGRPSRGGPRLTAAQEAVANAQKKRAAAAAARQAAAASTKALLAADAGAGSDGEEEKTQSPEEIAAEEERQRLLDEEEDIELETRLLADLDSSGHFEVLDTDSTIPLAAPGEELPDTPREQEEKESDDGVRGKPAPLLSQVDPLVEQALLQARLAQKERQAAINAALHSSGLSGLSVPKSSAGSGSASQLGPSASQRSINTGTGRSSQQLRVRQK